MSKTTELLRKRTTDARRTADTLAESARKTTLTEEDEAAFRMALDTIEESDTALRALAGPAVKVTKEPRVFDRNSGNSYFLARAATVGHEASSGHVTRHRSRPPGAARSRDEVESTEFIRTHVAQASCRAAGVSTNGGGSFGNAGGPVSQRTGDLTSSIAGGPPPVWILEEYATALYAASPLLARLRNIPLPPQTMQVNVPAFDNSDVTFDPQNPENTAVPDIMGDETSVLTHDVSTFTGDTVISQQLSDRGPNFDTYIAQSFAEASAASIEQQVIAGTGSSNQLLGLLNVPSTVSITSSGPPADVVTFTTQVAQTAAAVSDARNRMPSLVVLRGSRFRGSPEHQTPLASRTKRSAPGSSPPTATTPSTAPWQVSL